MQPRGQRATPSNPSVVPATDDEIREKYLERAIRELNQLTHEIQGCDLCPRGSLMPVLGSGHPQADVFMVKFAPRPSEIEEGVAFYGRSGSALMKSFKRLGIDPLAVYGTVFVKCPVHDTDLAAPECKARVLDELAVVQHVGGKHAAHRAARTGPGGGQLGAGALLQCGRAAAVGEVEPLAQRLTSFATVVRAA